MAMKVHMTPEEQALFAELLSKASSYTEFGAGGSTVLAASLISGPIVSTDSSTEWLERVAAECAGPGYKSKPQLVLADIGPIREWGNPADESCRNRWPLYPLSIWSVKHAANADLFLVDGRFRIACFLEILLRCRADARIAFHDYRDRPGYHIVEKFANVVNSAGTLFVFERSPTFDWAGAISLLDRMRYSYG
jgi:hypothetical protein